MISLHLIPIFNSFCNLLQIMLQPYSCLNKKFVPPFAPDSQRILLACNLFQGYQGIHHETPHFLLMFPDLAKCCIRIKHSNLRTKLIGFQHRKWYEIRPATQNQPFSSTASDRGCWLSCLQQLLPCYSEAHNNLGVIHASRGEYEAAHNHFNIAVTSDQDNVDAWRNLKAVNSILSGTR